MEIQLTAIVVSHTLKIGVDRWVRSPPKSSCRLNGLQQAVAAATATAPDDVGAPPVGKAPIAAVPQPPDIAPFLTKRPTPSSRGASRLAPSPRPRPRPRSPLSPGSPSSTPPMKPRKTNPTKLRSRPQRRQHHLFVRFICYEDRILMVSDAGRPSLQGPC
jgi:hypothetical protein